MHPPTHTGSNPNRRAPLRSWSAWLMLGCGVGLVGACEEPARDCEVDSQCAETVAPPTGARDAEAEAGPKDEDRDASVVTRSDAATKNFDASTTTKLEPSTKDTVERDAGGAPSLEAGAESTSVPTGESDAMSTSGSGPTSTSASNSTSNTTSGSTTNTSPRRLANIGQPCTEGRDCRSGQCFSELDAEGSFSGWTAGACFDDCTTSGECPTGSDCVSFGVVAYCLASCDAHDDCREDYACYPTDPSICLPDCSFLAEGCGEGYVCNSDGACEPEPDPEDCCQATDPCEWAVDDICDCGGDFEWDAVDCAPDCTPDDTRCSDNTLVTCDQDGFWTEESPCDGQACVDGACVGECEPQSWQCDGLNAAQCDELGQLEAPQVCEWGCVPGEGCDTDLEVCTTVCRTQTCDVFYGCSCTSSITVCEPRACTNDDACGTLGFCGADDVCLVRETCSETSCQNGGTCAQEGLGIICTCVDGYHGPRCEDEPCVTGEFTCNDGYCIDDSLVCDQFDDCSSGEDEVDCTSQCGAGSFTCDDGECIIEGWVCDGVDDCSGDEDEAGCSTIPCDPESFTCNDGSCIDNSWVCDDVVDCPDVEDELGCPSECESGTFACYDGECIAESAVCDGDADCTDEEDEIDCPNTCETGTAACNDGQCIDVTSICDGEADCSQSEDEIGCCEEGFISCFDGECIAETWVCDGEADCTAVEDEIGCYTEWICDPEYYDAADGCDCGCGVWDPDCDVEGQEIFGCSDGAICVPPGVCSLLP